MTARPPSWLPPPGQPQQRRRQDRGLWIFFGSVVLAISALGVVALVVSNSRSSTSRPTSASLADTCVRSGYSESNYFVEVRCYLGDGTSYARYMMSPAEARAVAPRITGDLPRELR